MKNNKGFTLIELLMVVAIIGVLSALVLSALTSSRNKAIDTKIKSQLKSMVAQAPLFANTGIAYVTPDTLPTSSAITGAAAGGTSASGLLFNDTTLTNNGLYNLMSKLPSGTTLYYGWDGTSTINGGRWFVAAKTSNGATCVDYRGTLISWIGTAPSIVTDFTTAFSTATAANGYKCN